MCSTSICLTTSFLVSSLADFSVHMNTAFIPLVPQTLDPINSTLPGTHAVGFVTALSSSTSEIPSCSLTQVLSFQLGHSVTFTVYLPFFRRAQGCRDHGVPLRWLSSSALVCVWEEREGAVKQVFSPLDSLLQLWLWLALRPGWDWGGREGESAGLGAPQRSWPGTIGNKGWTLFR